MGKVLPAPVKNMPEYIAKIKADGNDYPPSPRPVLRCRSRALSICRSI